MSCYNSWHGKTKTTTHSPRFQSVLPLRETESLQSFRQRQSHAGHAELSLQGMYFIGETGLATKVKNCREMDGIPTSSAMARKIRANTGRLRPDAQSARRWLRYLPQETIVLSSRRPLPSDQDYSRAALCSLQHRDCPSRGQRRASAKGFEVFG